MKWLSRQLPLRGSQHNEFLLSRTRVMSVVRILYLLKTYSVLSPTRKCMWRYKMLNAFMQVVVDL